MTRHSKRQCVLPISEATTSQTEKRTIPDDNSIVNHHPSTINDLNLQRVMGLVQDKKCIADLRPDGSIIITPLKSYCLPNEIIALILALVSQPTLCQCTFANKQFYALANPLLWKTPNFRFEAIYDLQNCLNRMPLERRHALGHLIETLDLHDSPYRIHTNNLLPYMACLKHFMVDGCFIPMLAKDVALLPKHCPQLISIRLHSVHVSESTFMNLAKRCQLTDFDWLVSSRQRAAYLIHLAVCPLRRLSIRFDYRRFDPGVVPAILAFDQLTCLELWTTVKLPNTLLKPTAFPGLTILRLSACDDLTNTDLIAFVETHPHLEQLDLRFASRLTDLALDPMLLLPLTLLTISYNHHITSAAVHRLTNACPHANVNVYQAEPYHPPRHWSDRVHNMWAL